MNSANVVNRLVCVSVAALCAASALAMPTQADLKKVQSDVVELMSSAMAEYQGAGTKEKEEAACKVGDASCAFAKEATTEAAKFMLLKGAATYYVRGRAYDKAGEALQTLKTEVKSVPPSVICEIVGKLGKISETKAPKLYAISWLAKLQVRAATDAKKLPAPRTAVNQRRYAEDLAISKDWAAAGAEFAKVNNAQLKKTLDAESALKGFERGDFWWTYEPALENADNFFRLYAASLYKKSLAANEIPGLKKNIVEKRLAGLPAWMKCLTGVEGGAIKAIAKSRDSLEFNGFLPSQEVLLWKNVQLKDINHMEAMTCGKHAGNLLTKSSHMKGTDNRRTFQFQFDNGGHRKCVIVALIQRGENVYGYAVSAKYGVVGVEKDFEVESSSNYSLASNETSGGYGLKDIRVIFDNGEPARGASSSSVAVSSPASSGGKAWQEKGNTAWLDLGEKGKLEFVKCPAGSFKRLMNAETMARRPVRITRDFWIMKSCVTAQQASFMKGVADWNYKRRSVAMPLAEYITDAFSADMPKGLVLRLPTAAEWEYAFHANTHDRKSPWYDICPGAGDRKASFVDANGTCKPNDWGFTINAGWELFLDLYTKQEITQSEWNRKSNKKVDHDHYWVSVVPEMESTNDPIAWTEDEKALGFLKAALWKPWDAESADQTSSQYRFVVGPDLVSEWKAKHGKK